MLPSAAVLRLCATRYWMLRHGARALSLLVLRSHCLISLPPSRYFYYPRACPLALHCDAATPALMFRDALRRRCRSMIRRADAA